MYDTSKPLGHVIRIIDEYTIIVDAGANALSVDDFIQIYQPCDYIYDLDGNVLSEYFCIKDELKVIDVQEKYSVCRKVKEKVVQTSRLILSPLLETQHRITEKLSVESSELQPLEPIDMKIHVGDFIKIK